MMTTAGRRVGFVCSYTPLPLIHAAGLVPYRILPLTEVADAAGALLHDSMCPHVKRILDRLLGDDLPPLAGTVIVASCDAMRRLADAWRVTRGGGELVVVELPAGGDEAAVEHFAAELQRLREILGEWSGEVVSEAGLRASIAAHDGLARDLDELAAAAARGELEGGWQLLQELRNRSVTEPLEASRQAVQEALARRRKASADTSGAPLLLAGNVLPDPEALALFAACGARLVGDDLCTGSRQLRPLAVADEVDQMAALAGAVLGRPPCARTVNDGEPGFLGQRLVAEARAAGARGVVLHVMKFCDPYLVRLAAMREQLRAAGLPLLVLEGDCSLRSLGQHRTRIEAFVEMLEAGA
jgi:benzoyl-CoA reductase/2-hydroxyglutaryl-CoA dehydratase subunit BcrC/BadD/HgdB